MPITFEEFEKLWKNTGTEDKPSMTFERDSITLMIVAHDDEKIPALRVSRLNGFDREPITTCRYECCLSHMQEAALRVAYGYFCAITHVGVPNPNSPWAQH